MTALLDRLALAVVGVEDVDDLAALLHDTSCPCTESETWTRDACRDYRSGRYGRWARQIQYEISERTTTRTPRNVGELTRQAEVRSAGGAVPSVPAQRDGAAGTPTYNDNVAALEVAA